MTARDAYKYTLTELNKDEAPHLLLDDWVYLWNKGQQQYINKVYNRYEMNQQSTDDLRVLKSGITLPVQLRTDDITYPVPNEISAYYCILPNDYLHMLNCVITFDRTNNKGKGKCDDSASGLAHTALARKLTADMYPSIIQNAYFKPSYKNPYYSITNATAGNDSAAKLNSILHPCDTESLPELDSVFTIANKLDSLLNPCDVKDVPEYKATLDIRCGDDRLYVPKSAYIEYLREPTKIHLSYEELNSMIDQSQVLEFPEYVCYEIINEVLKLILENSSDPRLQTNVPINQTILNPLQTTK